MEIPISTLVDVVVCTRVNRDNVLFRVQFSRPFEKLLCLLQMFEVARYNQEKDFRLFLAMT